MKVGDFSRGGRGRAAAPLHAVDHDMAAETIVVPWGILELHRGSAAIDQLWILFGQSKETSDFIADGLERWWNERGTVPAGVKRLQIELDNGPEIGSSRRQFMKRWVAFADRHRVEIELVYLPPYHSKYNPIERCWGVLEQHWNGTLLRSVADVLQWAGRLTWRTLHPLIGAITTTYERGVRLTKAAFGPFERRLIRSPSLPQWSLIIQPE